VESRRLAANSHRSSVNYCRSAENPLDLVATLRSPAHEGTAGYDCGLVFAPPISTSVAALALVAAIPVLSLAQTVKIKGTVSPGISSMAIVKHLDPTKILTLDIRFALRNRAQLDQLIAAQMNPARRTIINGSLPTNSLAASDRPPRTLRQ
jgi:hypothetical protein